MNTNFWKMYKQQEEYNLANEIFNTECDEGSIMNHVANLFDMVSDRYGEDYDEDNSKIAMTYQYLLNIIEDEHLNGDFTRENYEKFIDSYKLVMSGFTEEGGVYYDEDQILVSQEDYRRKASLIEPLSLFLYYVYEGFKPLLFSSRFDIIQKNCNALGIELPPIPQSNDYKQYCMYYFDICEAINEFQIANGLTDAEMCTCLYFYAPLECNNQIDVETELPEPTNVWITGTKLKSDFALLDKIEDDPSVSSIWACNERTKRGDIVIMYCNSPRSYIHSIWRATSDGIFNPFDNWHCRTFIGHGVRIPEIGFHELKTDEYMSKIPIVRKSLQGLKGVEFSAKDYSELLRMISNKNFDISRLPKLLEGSDVDFGEIRIEKDVEEKILIPMLEQLGYKQDDWTRQLSQKKGRTEKQIPDFVFFPTGKKHFENAPLVIEAKLDMSSMRERHKAFDQCLSYVKSLHSKLMGICDKERLVIYKVTDTGIVIEEPVFEKHWSVIYSDGIVKSQLKQIIGREIVKSL